MANLQEKADRLRKFLRNQTWTGFTTPEGISFSLTVMGNAVLAKFPPKERGYSHCFATSDMEVMREFLDDEGFTFSITETGVPKLDREGGA